MKQLKSADDLMQLPTDDPAYPLVADLVKRLIVDYEAEGYRHEPDSDGWIVLIDDPSDQTRVLHEIWDDWTLLDIPWEGIAKTDGYYQAVFLANNQFGLVFVIPDAEWLTQEVRGMIERHLDDDISQEAGNG